MRQAYLGGGRRSGAVGGLRHRDRLYVTQTGEVGLIGVVAVHRDESGADAQAGLAWTFVHVGAAKVDGNPHQPLSDSARTVLQADVDALYGRFVDLVAQCRKKPPEAIRATEAAVYRGDQAVAAGLADKVGTGEQAADPGDQAAEQPPGGSAEQRGDHGHTPGRSQGLFRQSVEQIARRQLAGGGSLHESVLGRFQHAVHHTLGGCGGIGGFVGIGADGPDGAVLPLPAGLHGPCADGEPQRPGGRRMVTQATGTAEREAALKLVDGLNAKGRIRYPPLPSGSRFRGPLDPGVFYGADEIETACAELGYWRWRFLMESPALEAIGPKPQTLFQAEIDTLTIDLRAAPFSEWQDKWVAPSDYAATQEIARLAREVEIGAIRYESVRAPNHGGCAAVLLPAAFAVNQPQNAQTWWLSVNKERVMWQRDDVLQRASLEFDTQTFGL